MTAMKEIFAGVDVGSSYIKTVLISDQKKIIHKASIKNVGKINEPVEDVFRQAGLFSGDKHIIRSVATGYGKTALKIADGTATEVACLREASVFIDSSIRTIIDIGGQDSKIISLNDSGNVDEFVFNDKCAAGTGKFLENLASLLEISITKLGEEVLQAKQSVSVSSVCTVFANSEIVSLIAAETPRSHIVRGFHEAFAMRIIDLVQRVGLKEKVVFTGGVAKNIGLFKILEKKLNARFVDVDDPQIVCAFGAALVALKRFEKKK